MILSAIFPPLILYLFLKKRWVWGAIALAALILSHNATSLMFMPVIGLYGIYVMRREKEKLTYGFNFIGSVVLGFGLSAFFWMPALLEGKFTLRDIVTAGEALSRFVPWQWFVYSPWNYSGTDNLTKFLGFGQWFGILAAMYVAGIRKKHSLLIWGALFLLLFSLFIQTSWSAPIWHTSKIMQDFQFPWRFLSLSLFLVSVAGGAAFAKASRVNILIFSLFIILPTIFMWYPKGYQYQDDSFYSGIYPGTTDTGESSPVWSTRFMEHRPDKPMDVIDGEAVITAGTRTSTIHTYTINAQKPSLMLENTLYFPGWTIYVNGAATPIEWQNQNYRGLMTFRIDAGVNQTVRVVFEDTKVRKTADIISLVSLGIAGIIGGIWLIKSHFR